MKRFLTLALAPTLAMALLVLAGCTARPRPAPSAGPPASPAPAAPAVGDPFGAHWDWSRYDQFAPYLKGLAGSATFYELSWCDIEATQGKPDWSALDQVAQRSKNLGIRLQLKIRTGTCWATGGSAQHTRGQANKTESAMPRDMAAYQTFVSSVVQRYGPYGVTEYAIENEANSPSYWSGSPADYRTLVTAAAQAIRTADPKATVVDSGISSVGYGIGVVNRLLEAGQGDQAVAAYQAYFQRRIGTRGDQLPTVDSANQLRTVLGKAANARSLRFLEVTEKLLADHVVTVRQVHYYEPYGGVPALLSYLRATTPAGTPVEAWEVGQFWQGADTDSATRADEMVKTVVQLLAGGVREVIWLPLAYNPDNRQDSEVRYGLLDPDGTERPAGRMLAGLSTAARDSTVQGVAGKGLTGVAFTHASRTTLVLWAGSGTVTVPAGPGMASAAVGATPAGSGPVKVGGSPVLIAQDRPVAAILATVQP
jgi:hypothetical protein